MVLRCCPPHLRMCAEKSGREIMPRGPRSVRLSEKESRPNPLEHTTMLMQFRRRSHAAHHTPLLTCCSAPFSANSLLLDRCSQPHMRRKVEPCGELPANGAVGGRVDLPRASIPRRARARRVQERGWAADSAHRRGVPRRPPKRMASGSRRTPPYAPLVAAGVGRLEQRTRRRQSVQVGRRRCVRRRPTGAARSRSEC